jgi:membrane-associated protease RseP (regulator of RpoE activity)
MQPRMRVCWLGSQLLIALGAFPAAMNAQATGSTRDSDRVYRIQLRRAGDTVYVGRLRATREQLRERLDSLQREFEGLGRDAPDRIDLVRELRTIISSLGDLGQLEQHAQLRFNEPATVAREKARALARGQVFAVPMPRLTQSLQPGWIGISVEAPHQRVVRNDSAFIRYFAYPEVISVEPNSPAEHVGISRGDYLLAYDGADLRDREINLTRLLRPSRRITVTVRRDGEERDFSVVVARAPRQVVVREQLSVPDLLSDTDSMPVRIRRTPRPSVAPPLPGPLMPFGEPGFVPVAGAKLVAITNESLGHIFGVSSGVLVTEVFGDPAESSGLRGGDVICRADGRDITDVAQLRRIVAEHGGDRNVELEIVRQKRTRSLTLRW